MEEEEGAGDVKMWYPLDEQKKKDEGCSLFWVFTWLLSARGGKESFLGFLVLEQVEDDGKNVYGVFGCII